jgi:hypothetical protein
MKNVFKLSFAALTLSLVMMLSPTQINANYMSLADKCKSGKSKCKCSNGCWAGGGSCGCYPVSM